MRSALFPAVIPMLFAALVRAHPGSEQVIDYFSGRIDANPRQQALYLQRGIAYSNDGQLELALQDLRRAQELGDPVAAALDLGIVYYRKRDFVRSREYLDIWLARFPDHPPALETRARASRAAGDAAGAVADYRALLAVQPHPNPGHYVAAADILAAEAGEGTAQALALLDAGLAKLGLLPQLQRPAVALELRRGRPLLAVERMRTLEAMLGSSPEWQLEMAELLLQAGQPGAALAHFDNASRQLATARATPARQQLAGRLESGRAAAAAGVAPASPARR